MNSFVDVKVLEQAGAFLKKHWPGVKPICGMILGSGWGEVASVFTIKQALRFSEIPGYGKAGVSGHYGNLLWAESFGLETLIFQGRRHWYEGEGWTPIALPIYLLKMLGAKVVILTCSVGAARSWLMPGDLALVKDHINLMGLNPLVGFSQEIWGSRFVDLSELYDVELQECFSAVAHGCGERVSKVVLAALSGPNYETPAEIRMVNTLGADIVGMSVVPEAIVAHAAGMKVLACALVTNMAAGSSATKLSHEEVIQTGSAASERIKHLFGKFWEELSKKKILGGKRK